MSLPIQYKLSNIPGFIDLLNNGDIKSDYYTIKEYFTKSDEKYKKQT